MNQQAQTDAKSDRATYTPANPELCVNDCRKHLYISKISLQATTNPKSAHNRLPNVIQTPHLKHINTIYRTQLALEQAMNYNRTVMLLVSLSDLLLLLDFLITIH